MGQSVSQRVERARTASGEELRALVHEDSPEVLAALLENPALREALLQILLERKELPADIVQEIARQKNWMRSYPVKLRVARHPHTPRLTALPLLKQLYLFDLVRLSLTPGVPGELRRVADDLILARLPQLPLGEKLTLARRGSGRVAGALLAEGHPQTLPLCLDNGFMNEAQVLKVLGRSTLAEGVVEGIARHGKWSYLYNVRMALVRHPLTPLARVLAFLPDLTLGDLTELSKASTLSENLRKYIRGEISARRARSKKAALRAPAKTTLHEPERHREHDGKS